MFGGDLNTFLQSDAKNIFGTKFLLTLTFKITKDKVFYS